ncbi:MAG: beta-hydroxyacyl-ACP dehydratase, partial [Deltaproteobacteria bacterium]|nr:beta-hydroxyacyl-ACP dehydratase [Deltaproteobacteria bacterium]
LVDSLLGLDLTEGEETVFGSRYISGQDPVFAGHFPDFPIYPGTLQLEMAGQLGLCLTFFVINQKNFIPLDARPMSVRATKVLGALFLEPVLPEVTVTLISQKLEYDGYFGTVISQVLNDGKVCCVSISEVIFLDNS